MPDNKLQQVKQTQKKDQQALDQSFKRLQTWGEGVLEDYGVSLLSEEEYIAETREKTKKFIIRKQLEANERLGGAVQQQVQPAQAHKAAAGAPEQPEPPAELTRKQRRERARREKAAKKHNKSFTADTYDMHEGLNDVIQSRNAVVKNYAEEFTKKHVDPRVLNAFCDSFHLNKRGLAASKADRQIKKNNEQFVEDYLSCDVKKREKHLNKMCEQIMHTDLTFADLTDAKIQKNSAALKSFFDRALYFENVQKDPVNKPYFDALPPEELAALNVKLDLYVTMGSYFADRAASLGVDNNSGEYLGEGAIKAFRGLSEVRRGDVQNKLDNLFGNYYEAMDPVVEKEKELCRKDIIREAEATEKERRKLDNDTDPTTFTNVAIGYAREEVDRVRDHISSNPERYEALSQQQKRFVENLYQGFYHTMDLVNDMVIEARSLQVVIDRYREDGVSMRSLPMHIRALVQNAVKRSDELDAKSSELRQHATAISDLIDYLVRGKKLSAAADDLRKQRIYQDAPLHKKKKDVKDEDGEED